MNRGRQKKIIFYVGGLGRGGTERVVVNLAKYLQGQQYTVVIATTTGGQGKDEYPLPDGVRRVVTELSVKEITGSRIRNFYGRVRKLRRIWKEEKPDLIVSFIKKNNLMAILSSRALGIPVLVAVRSAAFVEYSGAYKWYAKVLFPLAAGVIVQTEEQRNYFGKLVRNKAHILPNSINPDFMAPVYEGKRNNEIITVGRMDEDKNQIMLINAFARIADQFPTTKVIIYGDGEAREKVQKSVQEHKLNDRVILAGQVADVKAKIEKARIFVLTSRIEGIPNAMIEAMACGLVPISTDFGGGGVRQLIQDGKNGFIVPVDDTVALAEKMKQILSIEELEERMRSHAIEVQKQFAPEQVNRQWALYFLRFLE